MPSRYDGAPSGIRTQTWRILRPLSLPIGLRVHLSVAEGAGFEPAGLAPQQISGLRRYDHFGIPPHVGRRGENRTHWVKSDNGFTVRPRAVRDYPAVLVMKTGFEPATRGLKDRYSTN